MRVGLVYLCLALCLMPFYSFSQDQSDMGDVTGSVASKLSSFSGRLLRNIEDRTQDLDRQLTRQTEKYMAKMARREARLRDKLYSVDSGAAKDLFRNSSEKYAALSKKLREDSGAVDKPVGGAYQANTDSLLTTLNFLRQHPEISGSASAASIGAGHQLQILQAKMQDADQIKVYVRQRKQEIGDYLSQHAGLAGKIGAEYKGMQQDMYYYSQQVKEYKELLNHPDVLAQRAMALLNQLPAFQTFMKNNSQLASLFRLPAGYGSPESLAGLQTRDQVNALIQGQVAAAGPAGASAMQSGLESARSQLDNYKDKLSQAAGGGGDIDMPDLKPNGQKVKTFWKRLEYGTNFQTTKNSRYFPTVTDMGLSVGYRLNNSSKVGLGASYKLGWGSGFDHIRLSSQGLGLRSFIDVKIKGNFSATGGLEYNYNRPFASMQQLRMMDEWTRSGLIGVTKSMPIKNRAFKKTRLQLLWDFLSYRQVPKTPAILFRIGYDL